MQESWVEQPDGDRRKPTKATYAATRKSRSRTDSRIRNNKKRGKGKHEFE